MKKDIAKLTDFYENALFKSVMPFWEKYSIDKKYGGYLHYLNRGGEVLSGDKSIWLQARQCYIFSKLYNDFGNEKKWLGYAKSGYEFLMKYGFDSRGKMYFSVTRNGISLRMRRYYFSEFFMVMALAEYGKAANEPGIIKSAKRLYERIQGYYIHGNDELLPPKFSPSRPMISHSIPMCFIITGQVLRDAIASYNGEYDGFIMQAVSTITNKFYKKDLGAVMENVTPEGEIIDTPSGRLINPGHAIESAWFIMHEAMYLKDGGLVKIALDILDFSFERGWDKEYGGLYSFLDYKGLPPEKIEWALKFWWPHNELLYCSMLAYYLTKEDKYFNMYEKSHNYAFDKFADDKYGEWFGYLNRDGSINLPIKGSEYKGAFHVPRQLILTLQLLKEMGKK